MPLKPRFELHLWGPLLRDTLPFAVAIAVNAAYFRIALLFMSVASSDLETGYFAASFRIVEVLIAIPPVVLAAAFPILSRAARDDEDRFAYATGRLFEVALILGGLCVVGVELGAELAVRLLAGDDFEPAVSVLRIQSPTILATFAAVACAYPLLSLRRHRETLITNLFALAVSVVLLLALVSPFGAEGAAVATLSAEVALAISIAILLRRSHAAVRFSPATIIWVLVATGAAIGVGLLSGLPSVPRIALGVVVYGVLMIVSRRIPEELMQAVRR